MLLIPLLLSFVIYYFLDGYFSNKTKQWKILIAIVSSLTIFLLIDLGTVWYNNNFNPDKNAIDILYEDVKEISTVKDAKKWIDEKNQDNLERFSLLCNQKDNDSKKEQALTLYRDFDNFYYLQGEYDISKFSNLSYDEQKKVEDYSRLITSELPSCMKKFLETSNLCEDCWGIHKKDNNDFKTTPH